MHRAFIVFLTILLINDVRTVYAGRDLEIIAQQGGGSQTNATRAEAEKLTKEGIQLFKQGTAESLLAARKKWEAALVLWQKLGDKKWQALILTSIGRVYDNLGDLLFLLHLFYHALFSIRDL